LAYSIGISVYYLAYGASLDYLPALIFLAVMPIMTVLSSLGKLSRYWIAVVSMILSYEALQGAVGSLASSRGIHSLYSVDKILLGFNLTGWVQSTLASPAVTVLAATFYTMHVPLIFTTCAVVWFAKRELFGKYFTVMIFTSYAALVTFFLLPTAPPWYTGVAGNLYQSTIATALPGGFASVLSLAEVDKFAAFPSLHGAYAIISSYFMVKIDRRLALVSIPVTIGILFSTLYLGQHYLIDLIGGATYALIPCLIAERFQIHLPGTQNKGKIETPG
jgi:membrane-associated phospholipid phosphatase